MFSQQCVFQKKFVEKKVMTQQMSNWSDKNAHYTLPLHDDTFF